MPTTQQVASFAGACITCAALCIPITDTLAQTPQNVPPSGETQARVANRSLSIIVRALAKETGFAVVTDTATAQCQTPPPEPATDAASLELRLDNLVRSLPKGTRWVKINLPEPASDTKYSGDDLADFVQLQARLFKNANKITPENGLEVLGQRVAVDKEAAVTVALRLRPVYLVFASVRAVEKAEPPDSMLTKEQQQQKAQRVAEQLAKMSPENRARALEQMLHQPNYVLQGLLPLLTPDQRGDLIRDMGGWTNGNQAGLELTMPPK